MPARDDPFEFSLARFLDFVARNRRTVLGTSAVLAVLTFVVVLVLPRNYSSSSSFLPQQDQTASSSLANLASQFGVALPLAGSGMPLDFYGRLLTSRPLLEATVTSKYRSAGDGVAGRVDLVERLHARGSDWSERVEGAMKKLRERIDVEADTRTGLVSLRVTTHDPLLSRGIAARMVGLVNEFNLSTRRTNATEQLDFIEAQVGRAQDAVDAMEDTLETFIRANRRFEQSPELTFEHDRLVRKLGTLQSVYTSLLTAQEQARIDAVRTTPVITVVVPAYLPAKPDRRYLFPKTFFAALVGFVLAVVGVAALDAVRDARNRDPEAFRWLVLSWTRARDRIRRKP